MHTDSTHSDGNAPGHHNSEHHAPSAAAMEDRYANNERVWSGDPNAALLNAVASMGLDDTSPRTALDIGCGEGADAVWLAQQGWQVTAIDHAPTAVRRTQELAAENGVQIDARAVSFQDFERAMFDLVICFFGQLNDDDVPKLESLVAPGGWLIFVHHDMESEKYLMPARLKEQLTELELVDDYMFDKNLERGGGAHHHRDLVLRARRR
ncbi:class I SAM-dependent methyltransferase [Corynebacterium propinquum]